NSCLPLCLLLSAEMYPKPTISLSPSRVIALGQDVTIWCQAGRRDARFSLFKVGDWTLPGHVEPAGAGGEFLIHSMRQGDRGSYYHYATDPFAWSEPSDPEELLVAGEGLPRPNISLSPTGVTAPGANVTIWCQGPRRDMRFFLHKAGDLNLQRQMDPAGDVAEFLIPTVGQQHRGSYSCSYRPQSEPFVSSQPSDTVQLVVAGEELGSASLFPSPHPVRSLGVSALMGRSEPGSALTPGPSNGDTQPWSRDRVTEGFPIQGKQQPLEVWGRGSGVSCPQRELQRRELFPGGC
uniref:Ig-like domain-containing protein n=1 Tax=Chelonoidis abingdonii TaxID=106734 RepID=A0A8C0HB88_CHEAB